LKDGKIGLFDLHGIQLSDLGPKSEGLQKYIKEQNKKGKKFFGGIVANTDRNYRGRWVYFDKASNYFKDNSFENWADLILIIKNHRLACEAGKSRRAKGKELWRK